MTNKKKTLFIAGGILGGLMAIIGIYAALVAKLSRELRGLDFSTDDFSLED